MNVIRNIQSPNVFVSVDTRHLSIYDGTVIRSFRHSGLKKMFEGNASRIAAKLRLRVALALSALDAAESPLDLKVPGYRLHQLKGDQKGTWSIAISGNWRITFRFEEGTAHDVDLIDYH
jgi:proteic killer suppression protein